MNKDGVAALLEHWELVLLLIALLAFGVNMLTRVFKLFFWNEDRIEKVATKLLSSPAIKNTMTEVATQVFLTASAKDNEIRAEMRQILEDLRKRDEERAAAVSRVHARIDEIQQMIVKWMGDMAVTHKRPQ